MSIPKTTYFINIRWKEILFFIFLWLLLYFEPIEIGIFKLSQIWKTILVLIMFSYLITKRLPVYVWLGVLFALKYLFYTYMPYGYLIAIQNALEAMIFPLFLGFFYVKYNKKPNSSEKLIHIAILLSLFFIYSSIPFLFGMQSLNPVSELDKYGIEGSAMKSLFYSIAVSSKIYTIATIVLINTYNRFSNKLFNKIIWLCAIILGIYFIYASWTRTAWLIFLMVLFFSLFYRTKLKRKIIAIGLSIIIMLSLVFLYESNQALQYRLTGGAEYRQNTELSVEQLASARLPFIIVAIDNLNNENLLSKFLGYGTQHGIDLFKQKTGMAIVSHNATFNILEASGIIGLLIYLWFIFFTFRRPFKVQTYNNIELRKLLFISLLLFGGFYLISHGTPFWGEIIFSSIIVANITYTNSHRNKLNDTFRVIQNVVKSDYPSNFQQKSKSVN